jgi:hypothetical protein
MTDGLLESIIQLERSIQAEVVAEQARASAWQARELTSLQASLTADRSAEEDRRRLILAGKRVELQREGAALEASASAWCCRMSSLDSATLSDLLKRHLADILPGGGHDHPHG